MYPESKGQLATRWTEYAIHASALFEELPDDFLPFSSAIIDFNLGIWTKTQLVTTTLLRADDDEWQGFMMTFPVPMGGLDRYVFPLVGVFVNKEVRKKQPKGKFWPSTKIFDRDDKFYSRIEEIVALQPILNALTHIDKDKYGHYGDRPRINPENDLLEYTLKRVGSPDIKVFFRTAYLEKVNDDFRDVKSKLTELLSAKEE